MSDLPLAMALTTGARAQVVAPDRALSPGGLDMFGGVYVVQRRTEGWKVTGIARAWIA